MNVLERWVYGLFKYRLIILPSGRLSMQVHIGGQWFPSMANEADCADYANLILPVFRS